MSEKSPNLKVQVILVGLQLCKGASLQQPSQQAMQPAVHYSRAQPRSHGADTSVMPRAMQQSLNAYVYVLVRGHAVA